MNVTLHLTICGVLVFFLVASFLYRKFIDDHDDHNIHLSNTASDARIMSIQEQHAKRIEMLDRLNKYLSVVVILYLLAIGIMAAYTGWFAAQA
jgi:predicted lysophospholipase L1 biosynthesis ABC-type transport system permease subunit